MITCSYRYEYYRNGRYQTATSSVSYTVSFKSIEAKLDVTELSLNVGQTATVKASFPNGSSISGSPNMTWESDDDYIATVSSKSGSTNWTGMVAAHMCGGDDGTLSFTLKPRKKGEFTVIEIFKFRGQETRRIKNTIVVK